LPREFEVVDFQRRFTSAARCPFLAPGHDRCGRPHGAAGGRGDGSVQRLPGSSRLARHESETFAQAVLLDSSSPHDAARFKAE
jgi:hypothetical protein